MINLQSIAHPGPDVISQIVEGEAVLIEPEGAQTQVLNRTGAYVWQLLDGQHTLVQIADELSRSFAVTPEQAADDVLAFVAQLAARDLVKL